ncbi:hypothetical protein [Lichenihabitans sp. Uapishka_5]|uniref:hypothetical protein n=1 Tax=Lichenihabitans sp. Uapishka_5 TaxID=3037302 RepID=UPI0029E7D061|nr:hypothetical protein [Lichenihabitans sp. Uapishka_5]
MNPGETSSRTQAKTLIAHLASRVYDTYGQLVAARGTDPHRADALELQFRTLTLLMASEPAQDWSEVEPKVIAAAFLRYDREHGLVSLSHSHLATLLDVAIEADHRRLNSDSLPN